MPRRASPRGTCAYCAAEVLKSGSKAHLAKCPARAKAISKAASKPGPQEALLHLRIQDAVYDEFWLDLEMRATAALEDLVFPCAPSGWNVAGI
jgi:hypothetical protein